MSLGIQSNLLVFLKKTLFKYCEVTEKHQCSIFFNAEILYESFGTNDFLHDRNIVNAARELQFVFDHFVDTRHYRVKYRSKGGARSIDRSAVIRFIRSI